MSESRIYEEEKTVTKSAVSPSRQEKPEEEVQTIVYSEERPVNPKLIRLRRFMVSFGVFLFLIVCIIASYQLSLQAKDLDSSIEKLEEQIAEEKGKTLEYRVEQNYYKSDQYKEEMARNRFRLIFPGETLIQVN